jgi:hypothetical protein
MVCDEYIQLFKSRSQIRAAVVTIKFDVIFYTISLMLESSSYSGNIDWNDIIKNKLEELTEDLGEVQEITQTIF